MGTHLYKWLTIFLLSVSAFPKASAGDKPVLIYRGEVLHPFYVSVTEINHNKQTGSLEITCKIFADDMEEVLKKNYKTAINLSAPNQQAQNDRYITDYITKHLNVTANGKMAKLAYVGFEKDSESVYCYFEVSNIPSIKKLDVTNSLLQDLTSDQINIIHVTVNGHRKSYKLDYPHKQASFTF